MDVFATASMVTGAGFAVEAGSLYIKSWTGNFVRTLGPALGAAATNQLLRRAGGNMAIANAAYFGSEGALTQWAASANSPDAGGMSPYSWIPFSGTTGRWAASSAACSQ
jgi:hypothetical protein